jgi:hypothetical protein
VSPATRFGANESKATKRPSAEIEGAPLPPFASAPAELTLTRSVVAVPARASPASIRAEARNTTSAASILLRNWGRILAGILTSVAPSRIGRMPAGWRVGLLRFYCPKSKIFAGENQLL